LILGFVGAACCSADLAAAAPRSNAWMRVDEAVRKGLPRSAIELLDPILLEATRERAWAEAAKAIARKVSLQSVVEGNRPEEKIRRLESQLEQAPEVLRPVFHTLLGHWYWQYFRQHRWRILERTRTAEPPGADLESWDLKRLFDEIDRQFSLAMSARALLRTIPVAHFAEFLSPGGLPDSYRPTLYDVVAHEALEFYSAGEQAGAEPEDAPQIAASGPVFEDVEVFLAWTAPGAVARAGTADGGYHPVLRAFALYQELLAFHRGDVDAGAFIDADISRLVFAKNVAVGEETRGRFQTAIERLALRWESHPLAATAWSHWARAQQEAGDFVAARGGAVRGLERHPDSAGGKLCHNLIQEIEAKFLGVVSERVWPDRSALVAVAGQGGERTPAPNFEVRYRNVSNVWFRALRRDWTADLTARRGAFGASTAAERRELLAQPVAHAWSLQLPPTPDFKERRESVSPPVNLGPGFYRVLASCREDFADTDNQVWLMDLWVSDLALIMRARPGRIEGFVLEARTGEPLAEAQIRVWMQERDGRWEQKAAATTDVLGTFGVELERGRSGAVVLHGRHGTHEVSTPLESVWGGGEAEAAGAQTVFFTDRRLYRPGQAIRYKGICLRRNPAEADYVLLAGRSVAVVFRDGNGAELARREHPVNDFGSFSGTFIAPRGRLLGEMSIAVEGEPAGQTSVLVEEYKRPKFHAELEAPKVAPRLGERVEIGGHARAYTGAPVDRARLVYRVFREVQWPPWWDWFGRIRPPTRRESQEIAHGSGVTDGDGGFRLEFIAIPERAVSEDSQPTFRFRVHVDVTDGAGETRSAERVVSVGYTALRLDLEIAAWQTVSAPVSVRLLTRSLDLVPEPAAGTVRIHRLVEPETVHASATPEARSGRGAAPYGEGGTTDPNQWPLGAVVAEQRFASDTNGVAALSAGLAAGLYRVVAEALGPDGKRVKAQHPLHVLDPSAARLGVKLPFVLAAPAWIIEPGREFAAVWGTGFPTGRAFVEVEHRDEIVERSWTSAGRTQQEIRRAVTEAMRGGFTLHVTQVRDNRAWIESRHVNVPWTNKELDVRWQHFRSKLQPGGKETWTAVVKPRVAARPAEVSVAEFVATLYDASLDQFAPFAWPEWLVPFPTYGSRRYARFANRSEWMRYISGQWQTRQVPVDVRYRGFLPEFKAGGWGRGGPQPLAAMAFAAPGAEMDARAKSADGAAAAGGGQEDALEPLVVTGSQLAGVGEPPVSARDLSGIVARRRLDETAFFFPHLTSDSNGVVRMEFTVPEALTTWRFLGLAHDRGLRSGSIEASAITAKELMVEPNPPRFLREGDQLEFTAKVSNLGAQPRRGRVRLELRRAQDDTPVDAAMGNRMPELGFDVAAGATRAVGWRLRVPDGLGYVSYRIVGASESLSDGEEGMLPVLARRLPVAESVPLFLRGPGRREFVLEHLARPSRSSSRQHLGLTLELVSNPAWYAVLALPSLVETPQESVEQTFQRFYANALAGHIARSDPAIERVAGLWRGSAAVRSPLERSPELKSIALEETPWMACAEDESQARQRIADLFDANRASADVEAALEKLALAQQPDGRWPWFPGGPASDTITLGVVAGFGRLRQLGVEVALELPTRALARLDAWARERHRDAMALAPKERNRLTAPLALYLYARSLFLQDMPLAAETREAVEFWLQQARAYWVELEHRETQAHLALALHRFDDQETPRAILKSIHEHSVLVPDQGRFWRDTELNTSWFRAPIETQALMIEAFDEILDDGPAVEECQLWLVQQKQTQAWPTSRATADAVYALLRRGTNWLGRGLDLDIELGGKRVGAERVGDGRRARRHDRAPAVPAVPDAAGGMTIEPGTGYLAHVVSGAEVRSRLGRVELGTSGSGVAWGALHWRYLEAIELVPGLGRLPLQITKRLFRRVQSVRGPVLEPMREACAVGDEIVVRLELSADRDFGFVYLKDQRASGVEPQAAVSGYRIRDGLGYYESVRDAAQRFFFEYLPKGRYVIEYSVRAQHRGVYPSGLATIECLYAPAFKSHAASVPVVVR
jgi:hypothetical protein